MLEQHLLLCPRGAGGAALTFSLARIVHDEARQAELAFVTPDKAPELLATFNKAWIWLQERVTMVEYELVTAEAAVSRRKGLVILDEAPAILEKKGLKTSQDIREAILTQDVEYQDLCERVAKIRAVKEFLRIKARGFENTFTAVKRVLQTDFDTMRRGKIANTVGGPSEDEISRPLGVDGFGKNRY